MLLGNAEPAKKKKPKVFSAKSMMQDYYFFLPPLPPELIMRGNRPSKGGKTPEGERGGGSGMQLSTSPLHLQKVFGAEIPFEDARSGGRGTRGGSRQRIYFWAEVPGAVSARKHPPLQTTCCIAKTVSIRGMNAAPKHRFRFRIGIKKEPPVVDHLRSTARVAILRSLVHSVPLKQTCWVTITGDLPFGVPGGGNPPHSPSALL